MLSRSFWVQVSRMLSTQGGPRPCILHWATSKMCSPVSAWGGDCNGLRFDQDQTLMGQEEPWLFSFLPSYQMSHHAVLVNIVVLLVAIISIPQSIEGVCWDFFFLFLICILDSPLIFFYIIFFGVRSFFPPSPHPISHFPLFNFVFICAHVCFCCSLISFKLFKKKKGNKIDICSAFLCLVNSIYIKYLCVHFTNLCKYL